MSIVKFKPTSKIQQEPNLPTVAPSGYKNIARDEKQIPVSRLSAYVSGSDWTVDYYSQLTSKTNDLREVDPGENPVYQQYTLVRNYMLRVTSPITSTFDQTTNITKVIGSSNMYSFIVPNVNDYFVTDAGDSRKGLFKITNIDRKSFNNESVYDITYDLIGYIDSSVGKELYDNLNSKFVKEYWFDHTRFQNGLYPLVLEAGRREIIDFSIVYEDLAREYFDTFFNRSHMTLAVPGQETSIYDPMLVLYVTKIVEPEIVPVLNELRVYTSERDTYLKQKQFWSLMLNRKYSDIKYSNKKMGLVSRGQFHSSTYMHGLKFSTLDYVVYPMNPDISTMISNTPVARNVLDLMTSLNGTTLPNGELSGLDPYIDSTGVSRHISYSTIIDDYYVLSENFYENTADKSVLEILVKNYLEHKSINRDMLRLLVNNYSEFNRLDQFYYGPIIITLVKEVVKGVHI